MFIRKEVRHLIRRKMMVAPADYILWPLARKLFYQFLHEKGYVNFNSSDKIIGQIDKIEPYFIEILKQQFS
jgi:hypothetical protein